ncbi:ArnT family glycosyltransferase [Salinimicrobium flavum]|uniref:ArnT family glycosyltransferase n=1 Tax=Salinimicrobium flavum TaxID=1737065 RepID=A0ABW5IXY5_9FLAO
MSDYLKRIKIFAIALALPILLYNFFTAESMKYDIGGDAYDYVSLGVSLAKIQKYGHLSFDDGLINELQKDTISQKNYEFAGHSTWRPPVWPILIAGVFLISGYSLTNIIIFKFLLHLLGIFIFYRMLKLLKFHGLGLIIGTFLYAVSPAWQLYSRVFLSEPITFFLITLWIYMLLRHYQKGTVFLWQAIVAGILILSHPYFLFLPFSVWIVLFLQRKFALKKVIISSFIATCIIFSWIVRNFYVLDTNEFVLTTSSGAVLAKGWNGEVIKNHTNTKGDLADETLVLADYNFDRSKRYNEVEKMQLYKNATLDFIRKNPHLILPIVSTKIKSAFNPFPETPRPGILEIGRWGFQFLALLSLLYIFVFLGNPLVKSLAWGLVISTIGITVITYSGFRFRMPQVGLELLLIVYAVNDLGKRVKSKAIQNNKVK